MGEIFIIVVEFALLLISIGLGLRMNDDWCNRCKEIEKENTKLKKELEECKK